jgi:RNA polymerase sigma factor (sigma-70 family)
VLAKTRDYPAGEREVEEASVQKFFPHNKLDQVLDAALAHPERFEAIAHEWTDRLDREDTDLEIRDPQAWRRTTVGSPKTSFIQQFRADVDSIIPLGREEEARLARRIEFARSRLERARRAADQDASAKESGSRAHRRLMRRSAELHALRSEMVERNLYLVLINVERYAQAGGNRLDLVQEGCVSLFRAVDGFDWRRGLLFRTYAVHWLNQAFRNYLYNHGHTVRVPVYLQKALKRINQASWPRRPGSRKGSSRPRSRPRERATRSTRSPRNPRKEPDFATCWSTRPPKGPTGRRWRKCHSAAV